VSEWDASHSSYETRHESDIAAWARQSVRLTTRQPTAYPGWYDVAITPYIQGFFDAILDPSVRVVSVQKGAQTGFSLAAHVALMYWIVCDSGPCLYVMPTDVMAKGISETRIKPLIEDSPVVMGQLLPDVSDFKQAEYHCRGMQVNFVGANSASALASRPVRYLINDELDKFPRAIGSETGARSLAMQRTKSFWNRKILDLSTPTNNVETQIQGIVSDGDQRRYMVPCLKCGHVHEIMWRNVKWEKDSTARNVHESVRYECPKCGASADTHGKNEMVRHGKWEATATGEPGHVSFYAPSILSPWVTLEYLAAKWINAQRDQGDLQDFINSELGEVWSIVNKTTDEKAIVRRRRQYKRGEKAFDTLVEYADNDAERKRILSVDVQKTCFWWVLREWRVDSASVMIDFGRADMWEEIVKLADESDCTAVMVDSGYGVRTSEVYQICLSHRFTPTKGASKRMAMPWTQNTINIFEGTRRQREGESIQLVTYDTIQIKGLLSDLIETGDWAIPKDVTVDYIRQMTSEEMIADKWVLKRGHRDNHLWDCEALQVLGAMIFGCMVSVEIEEESVQEETDGDDRESR